MHAIPNGLDCRNITASYPGGFRLESISFHVPPGMILGVLGPNGSGKSTLLHSLAGLLPVQTGEASWNGRSLLGIRAKDRARIMSVLPQRGVVPQDATALQLAVMGRYATRGVFGDYGEDDYKTARQALALTDCAAFANRPVSALSGGELQRVLLARCFTQGSPLLLLDEPAAALDPAHALYTGELLRRRAAEGAAIVLTLHDLNLAAVCCHALMFLREGRMLACGPVQDVFTPDILHSAYGAHFEVLNRHGRPPQAVFS